MVILRQFSRHLDPSQFSENITTEKTISRWTFAASICNSGVKQSRSEHSSSSVKCSFQSEPLVKTDPDFRGNALVLSFFYNSNSNNHKFLLSVIAFQ